MRALRVKGECLLKLKEFEQAKTIYREVLAERDIPWAKIGLGKTLFSLLDYEPATKLFKELIQEQPNVVESYDWLSRIEVAQGIPRQAQDTLEEAVSRSPKAVLRQMRRAQLALSNRSYLVSESAYRKSIKLANNSCYNSPNNYFQYVRTLLVKIDRQRSRICRDAYSQARLFLTRVRKEFEGDPIVEFRATMLESLVYYTHGDISASEREIKRASYLFSVFDRATKTRLAEEYISGLTLINRIEACEEFIGNIHKNAEYQDLSTRLQQRVQDGKQRMHCENLNNEAMELYKKGQIMNAYEKFTKNTRTFNGYYSDCFDHSNGAIISD